MKTQIKHWILAARPKTWSASVMPVIVACALSYQEGQFKWIPALICFFFALIAQIVSNLANDYFDFIKGSDRTTDRLGPKRAVSQGWISPQAMLRASILLMGFACLLGCGIIYYTTWKMIFVGIAVCVGAFLYSAGPYPLAYRGWGDVCVVLFYGIIPVGFTYYAQTLEWGISATVYGVAMGIVSTNILVANNYRDREQDRISGKKTTVVLFGEKFGRYFYLLNGVVSALICSCFLFTQNPYCVIFPIIYLIPHIIVWKKMGIIQHGKALNIILEQSARNVVLLGGLLILAIFLSN